MVEILMSKRYFIYYISLLKKKKILPEKEAIKFLVDVLKGFL